MHYEDSPLERGKNSYHGEAMIRRGVCRERYIYIDSLNTPRTQTADAVLRHPSQEQVWLKLLYFLPLRAGRGSGLGEQVFRSLY
jgi:hypothetical protein